MDFRDILNAASTDGGASPAATEASLASAISHTHPAITSVLMRLEQAKTTAEQALADIAAASTAIAADVEKTVEWDGEASLYEETISLVDRFFCPSQGLPIRKNLLKALQVVDMVSISRTGQSVKRLPFEVIDEHAFNGVQGQDVLDPLKIDDVYFRPWTEGSNCLSLGQRRQLMQWMIETNPSEFLTEAEIKSMTAILDRLPEDDSSSTGTDASRDVME
jgi:hypothetical protein